MEGGDAVKTGEDNGGAALGRVTVRYGETTLAELLDAGYTLEPGQWSYHVESQTVMCGFFEGGRHIGELVFYDIPEPASLEDLKGRAVGLVLLDPVKKRGVMPWIDRWFKEIP